MNTGKQRFSWYQQLFNQKKNLRLRQHQQNELVFYTQKAYDIEFNSPWGWAEMEGIHWRGDYDLTQHSKFSGQNLSYTDPQTHKKYLPYITETSGGVDRSFFFLLLDAYQEDKTDQGEISIWLKINPQISAYKMAIFPLASNKPELVNKARSIYKNFKTNIRLISTIAAILVKISSP